MLNNQKAFEKWVPQAEQLMRERRSVRGFEKQAVTSEQTNLIMEALSTGRNPFKASHRFKAVESQAGGDSQKLGTYGIIKGAKNYIISAATLGEEHLEALGFDMEYAVLSAQAQGLGTCWLGGTFNKGQFASALGLKTGEILPIVIPYGKPASKDGLMGRLIRNVAGSNNRKAFSEICSNQTYGNPLSEDQAGKYKTALEMVRLAPSASNKQPWRIVKEGDVLHFYLCPTKGYSDSLGYDIQRVDLGIAVCHFDAIALAEGIKGQWEKLEAPKKEKRDDLDYIISFVAEI